MSGLQRQRDCERDVLVKIYDSHFASKKKRHADSATQESPREPNEEAETKETKKDITRKWRNWKSDAPIKHWKGVEVDNMGLVVKLNLSGRKLKRMFAQFIPFCKKG